MIDTETARSDARMARSNAAGEIDGLVRLIYAMAKDMDKLQAENKALKEKLEAQR